MNSYDTWLKSIAIGLETMAKGIHSVAKTIHDMADAHASEEPAKDDPESINTEPQPSKASEKAKPQGTKTMPATDQPPEVNQKPATGVDSATISRQSVLKAEPDKMKTETPPKKAKKKAKTHGVKTMPATDQVLEVIQKSKTGVDNVTISKQTGLNQTQVSSALLRLKKHGKITSVRRGVHTAD